MAAGTVSLIVGPAECVVCDARVVPVGRTGLSRSESLPDGVNRAAASRQAGAMVGSGSRRFAVALSGNDGSGPIALLTRLLPREGAFRTIGARVDGALSAAAVALKSKVTSSRWSSPKPLRVVVPIPAADVWFPRFEMEEGAGAILRGAKALAEGYGVDVVVTVVDRALMQALQRTRTAAAQRWWPVLDHASYTSLAAAATLMSKQRAAIFVGSGVTGPHPFDGFDERMRRVAKRFGLTTDVPKCAGEARSLLEALIDKCRDDDSGGRWEKLQRFLDDEFQNDRHSLAAALAVSLPVDRVHALSPDGALDAASVDIEHGPKVSELLGNHREPETMSSSVARSMSRPGLGDAVARSVRADPPVAVFIGLERDNVTFEEVLVALSRSVPGFGEAEKLLLQHVELDAAEADHVWSTGFTRLTTPKGTRDERARAFEQMLDAFVALAWTGGAGNYQELDASLFMPVIRMVRASNTSVWALNGGAPGSGRR